MVVVCVYMLIQVLCVDTVVSTQVYEPFLLAVVVMCLIYQVKMDLYQ